MARETDLFLVRRFWWSLGLVALARAGDPIFPSEPLSEVH